MGLLDDAIREHLDLKRRRGADPTEVERAEREALGPVRRNRDPDDEADLQDEVDPGGGFAYDQEDDQGWHEAAPADRPAADPYDEFEDDEPEFDPVQPPDFEPRGSVRPRSLRESLDDEAPVPRDEAFPPRDEVPAPRDEAQRSFDDDPEPPFDEPEASTRPSPAPRVDSDRDWSAASDDDAFAGEPFPTTSGSPRRSADVGQETTEFHIEEAEEPEDEDEDREDMLEETPEFLQDTPDHDRLWFEQRPPRDFDFDG
jgi:hypothetical protein